MIIELGKLLNEVKVQTVTTGKGERMVLNNRIMIYQGKDRTTFVDITAWGGLAEFIAKHFKQGEEIYLEGELKNKSITIEGKSIQSFYILVDNARIVFGKNPNELAQEIE